MKDFSVYEDGKSEANERELVISQKNSCDIDEVKNEVSSKKVTCIFVQTMS